MSIIMKSRKYNVDANLAAKKLLSALISQKTDIDLYRETMFELGKLLGNNLAKKLDSSKIYCVASTVEDADYLAKGVIESISRITKNVYFACFWNDRINLETASIAPIYNKFIEDGVEEATSLIIVKSIMSGSCVVKTNITALADVMNPSKIYVVSPVMHKDSQFKLEKEFPEYISKTFEYLAFAIDSERTDSGEVIPGIGGSVYSRLGFENKNGYMPKLVAEKLFSAH